MTAGNLKVQMKCVPGGSRNLALLRLMTFWTEAVATATPPNRRPSCTLRTQRPGSRRWCMNRRLKAIRARAPDRLKPAIHAPTPEIGPFSPV